MMPQYIVTNKVLAGNRRGKVDADDVTDACIKLGWQPRDCEIEELPARKNYPETEKEAEMPEGKARDSGIPEVEKHVEEAMKEMQGEEVGPDVGFAPESKEVSNFPITIEVMPDDLKRAEDYRNKIIELVRGSQSIFLYIGQLLYQVREDKQWLVFPANQYESFKDYTEDLQLPMSNSYSWATRLVAIWEYLHLKCRLDEDTLLAIGVAKLSRLLPAARAGKLNDELLEKAKGLSDLDLRMELGHSVGEAAKTEGFINCPHCGKEIHNAQWVRLEEKCL